jgi:uncharacterized protein YmfQ (DUF2313 family)
LNNNETIEDKQKKVQKKENEEEDLSFDYFENMMKHDSYSRGKGGSIKQVRHG